MTRSKIIEKLENGKQLGVSKIIECDNYDIYYTYAIQKISDTYIVYESFYNTNTVWEDEKEFVSYYDSVSQVVSNFNAKYDVRFEDLNVCKGQKFFNEKFFTKDSIWF